MKAPALLVIALAMSVSALAQTSAPAAPALTAGAEFKGLRLDWDTVPGAAWYQLEYRAHENGPFVQHGDDFPATATSTRFSFPVHLFDWSWARYRLAACNSAGCSRSTAISVYNLRRDAVGYFKSSQPAAGARFGAGKDLSSDGYNMVVVEPAVTARDDESDLSVGGFAYVFRRNSDGNWTQRVRLDIHDVAYGPGLELNAAISRSGNTVAIGMPGFVPGPGSADAGAVDVFHFKDGKWSRTHIPKIWAASMGTRVSLSDSGYILAIDTTDNEDNHSVAVFKSINGVWTHLQDIVPGGSGAHCGPHVMSRDGRAIAQQCVELESDGRPRDDLRVYSGSNWSTRSVIILAYPPSEDFYRHRGFAIDATGNTMVVQFSQAPETGVGLGLVKVFKRTNGAWAEVAALEPGAWRSNDYRYLYGDAVSVSGDGQTIAVGDPADNGANSGPRAPPLSAGAEQTGAVYVYRLSGGAWKLIEVVKPNYNPNPGEAHIFGGSTALSGTGKTLIVAVPDESSSASGIGGNWGSTKRASSGAIFMY